MQQNTEQKQMEDSGRGGVPRTARGRSDGFAYGFYALLLLTLAIANVLLKQDSSRLLLIRYVI
jgi:hypothetical protein